MQCLIGRLAEKISASGRRDPRSRKARASLLPITAAQTSLHLPQTATSVVRQLSTARTEKKGLNPPATRSSAAHLCWLDIMAVIAVVVACPLTASSTRVRNCFFVESDVRSIISIDPSDQQALLWREDSMEDLPVQFTCIGRLRHTRTRVNQH